MSSEQAGDEAEDGFCRKGTRGALPAPLPFLFSLRSLRSFAANFPLIASPPRDQAPR